MTESVNWNEHFHGKSSRMTRVHVTPSSCNFTCNVQLNFDCKKIDRRYKVQYQATICYRREIGIKLRERPLPRWTGLTTKRYFVGPLRDLPGPSTSFSSGYYLTLDIYPYSTVFKPTYFRQVQNSSSISSFHFWSWWIDSRLRTNVFH